MNFLDIVANNAKNTLTITDESLKIVNAFRMCKRMRAHEIKGKFRLSPTDRAEGVNIRKSKLDDAHSVYRIFEPFTEARRVPLTLPFFDEARKTVVSTNGWAMLFCDTPEWFTLEKAKSGNFCTDANMYPNWTNVLNGFNRENSPHALSDFDLIGEVEKGSNPHNILQIAALSSRAYRHNDRKGLWHNLFLWVGENQYDPVQMSGLVNALFRLGCDKVGFYFPKFGYSYKALHLVGSGDGLNTRGLLAPVRFPSAENGAFTMPFENKAAKAA